MGLLHCGYWVDSRYDCWRPHPLANWVTIVSTALCHVSVISKGPACQYTFDGIVQESAAQRVVSIIYAQLTVKMVPCLPNYLWLWKIKLQDPHGAELSSPHFGESWAVWGFPEHRASLLLVLLTARGWRPSGACVQPSSPSSGGCSPAASATLKPSQKSTCQYCASYWFHVTHF